MFCGNVQVLVEDNQSVEPVETTVGNECHRLLPSACGQRWWDLRLTVHNCTWFLCDLLNQLKATQLPTATLVITLNEVFLQLVEVACKWTDDVCTSVFSVVAAIDAVNHGSHASLKVLEFFFH